MKRTSEKLRVNVSLAVADGDEMVYLYAVRRRDVGVPRRVTTGHRTPIEMTSLGHAYLATLPAQERSRMLAHLRTRYPEPRWKVLAQSIRNSVRQLQRTGYCRVDWLPGVTALATAVLVPGRPTYLITIGVAGEHCTDARIGEEIVPALLALGRSLSSAFTSQGRKSAQRGAVHKPGDGPPALQEL
jgi:DNA-binding IclR family transcriptional regulator